MKKLYFRYGSMMSGKSIHLITSVLNYFHESKKILVMKPYIPNATEKWNTEITCRMSYRMPVHTSIAEDTDLLAIDYSDIACIFVDESQFLTTKNVEDLREITLKEVPVICYGLRTNYKGKLFAGSRRLLELADSIEEIKTVCWKCDRKATMACRVFGDDSEIEIEENSSKNYIPLCYKCWKERKPNRFLA